MKSYEIYQKAKKEYDYAAGFLTQLDARDCISKRTFSYSPAHSVIKLTICGQHSEGGHDYHSPEASLAKAILESIDYRGVIAAGVEKLRVEMMQALVNCKKDVSALAKEIHILEAQDGFVAEAMQEATA